MTAIDVCLGAAAALGFAFAVAKHYQAVYLSRENASLSYELKESKALVAKQQNDIKELWWRIEEHD